MCTSYLIKLTFFISIISGISIERHCDGDVSALLPYKDNANPQLRTVIFKPYSFSATSAFNVMCKIRSWNPKDCQMERHFVMANKRVHVFELRGYFHRNTKAEVRVDILNVDCAAGNVKTISTEGIL